ncbi:MAG: hypothetical protein HOD92_08255 [Deltaproteobacteria bacterium]|jgi:hypothetical protein|nr:hypothetical protein [Deltaproteobacteria bacterium]
MISLNKKQNKEFIDLFKNDFNVFFEKYRENIGKEMGEIKKIKQIIHRVAKEDSVQLIYNTKIDLNNITFKICRLLRYLRNIRVYLHKTNNTLAKEFLNTEEIQASCQNMHTIIFDILILANTEWTLGNIDTLLPQIPPKTSTELQIQNKKYISSYNQMKVRDGSVPKKMGSRDTELNKIDGDESITSDDLLESMKLLHYNLDMTEYLKAIAKIITEKQIAFDISTIVPDEIEKQKYLSRLKTSQTIGKSIAKNIVAFEKPQNTRAIFSPSIPTKNGQIQSAQFTKAVSYQVQILKHLKQDLQIKKDKIEREKKDGKQVQQDKLSIYLKENPDIYTQYKIVEAIAEIPIENIAEAYQKLQTLSEDKKSTSFPLAQKLQDFYKEAATSNVISKIKASQLIELSKAQAMPYLNTFYENFLIKKTIGAIEIEMEKDNAKEIVAVATEVYKIYQNFPTDYLRLKATGTDTKEAYQKYINQIQKNPISRNNKEEQALIDDLIFAEEQAINMVINILEHIQRSAKELENENPAKKDLQIAKIINIDSNDILLYLQIADMFKRISRKTETTTTLRSFPKVFREFYLFTKQTEIEKLHRVSLSAMQKSQDFMKQIHENGIDAIDYKGEEYA